MTKLPLKLAIAVAVVGGLASAAALGMVMPWQAATKAEVRSVEDRHGARLQKLEIDFSKIDGKLDTVIQLLQRQERRNGGSHERRSP